MFKISATIVADSLSPQGHRITSYVLTYPRFIHAELMTHRMFSRNSASSRAIPFAKMVKMVEEDPFVPIAWQKDHSGMQGVEYTANLDHINLRKAQWILASKKAITSAKELNDPITKKTSWDDIGEIVSEGVTKQLCNRLLEPFLWHTVLVTATEYDNFFELRCPKYEIYAGPEDTEEYLCSSKSWKDLMKSNNGLAGDFDTNDIVERLQWSKSGAEIHIQALAEAMWDSMKESIPKKLGAGEWHIPFGDKMNDLEIFDYISNQEPIYNRFDEKPKVLKAKLKIAIARCARLSYMTFDGEIDYEKDIKLHDQLLESHHMSPFEHVSKCMSDLEYYSFIKGQVPSTEDDWGILNYEYYPLFHGKDSKDWFGQEEGENKYNGDRYGWCNNFRGFIPYRYIIENGELSK